MNNRHTENGIDIQILQEGAICKYYSNAILDEDLTWLRDNLYWVIDIDTRNWTVKTAHTCIKKQLDFPDHYGENMNAFRDCLRDIYPANHKGLVIVFRHFDHLATEDKSFCEGLLTVIDRQSREWLLFGKRLIGIAQSDDPHIEFDKVGGYHPGWNSREWLASERNK
jgi:RNAse (barnase) inhibitor barstar